jgi:predicted DsbA family dithiol-disulfide isomerase
MFRAFFQEEQNIGDINVLTKLAGEIGLNADEYKEALKMGKYKETHQKALEHAYQKKIHTVPTFEIGDTTIAGVRSKKTLERLIHEELEKQKTNAIPAEASCGIDGCK